tara:strand:- start:7545 stop:7766 length:222 start_codon:yes stop_codon:yes gene_type:complete
MEGTVRNLERKNIGQCVQEGSYHSPRLIPRSDDSASQSFARVSGLKTLGISALSEIIAILMHNEHASDDAMAT